jgi:ubiquinone/menaquinone biosynthesis C-methylase UbiE
MSDLNDQNYLLAKQYNTSTNLNARIELELRFSTSPESWFHWIFDRLQIPAHGRVLEIGSGSGMLWRENLDRIPADWQITLSDFSAGMLNDAQQNLGENAERFRFVQCDAQAIPFADDSFDCVIANHMLYHVPDRARAFAEIRRVLASEGHFYAATGGEAHLQEIKQLFERMGIGNSWPTGVTSFSVQNGAAQMRPWFAQVEIIAFEDSLVIPEVEPLIAFTRSFVPSSVITESKVQQLREMVEQELAEHGALHVTKETGLFVASGIAPA